MADPTTFAEYAAGFHNPFVYGSYYGGLPPPPRPPSFFGMNPAEHGAVGGAMQALMPMIAEMFRDQMGGYAFMFGSDMNVASARYANNFMRQTMSARMSGAQADQQQINEIFRGMAAAMGHQFMPGTRDFAPDVSRAIGRLAGDASSMMPVLAAMFPDTIDRMLPRGSMAVAASSFVNAGRFVIDPATGRPTAGQADFAAQVLDPLMARGLIATSGLGAGRLGSLYEELVTEGRIGSGRDLREQVRLRDVAGGLFGEGGRGVGMSGEDARGIQAGRIRDRLQSYSQAIAAINDIFAENGQANAPMAELIRGLQTLTQGGMGIFAPEELGRLTRSFHGAAQMSGMSLQGLTQLSATTGMQLERYGGHRGLAGPIALWAAAAGSVFADRGFGTPDAEAMGRSEFVGAVAGNRAAFPGSSLGNLLGAISALGRQAPEGSDFATLAAAVRRGETSVQLRGENVNLLTNPSRVFEIARQSGLGDVLLSQLQAGPVNQAQYIRNPGMIGAQLAMQRANMEGFLGAALGADFAGVDRGQLMATLYDVARGDFGGQDPSTENLAALVGERMGLSVRQRGGLAAALGRTAMFTRADGRAVAMLRMSDPTVQAEQQARMQEFITRGGDLAALTHLARGGIGRHVFSEFIRMGQEGGTAGTLLSLMRMGGMVSNEDVASALGSTTDLFGDLLKLGDLINPKAGAMAVGGAAINVEPEHGSAFAHAIGRAARASRGNAWRQRGDDFGEEGGFFEQAGNRVRRLKAAGPGGSTQIEIKVAKLVLDREGGANLKANGTAVTQ